MRIRCDFYELQVKNEWRALRKKYILCQAFKFSIVILKINTIYTNSSMKYIKIKTDDI